MSSSLYFKVIIAILAGVSFGYFFPHLGVQLQPLGDAFVNLVKMLIAPIIFTTVVTGIASMQDMKKVGKVGIKALIYFEAITIFALLIGLVVVKIFQPGVGINADIASLDIKGVEKYAGSASHLSTVDFILNIIPHTIIDAFAKGDILQVLLIAVLFGSGLAMYGEKGKPIADLIDNLSHVLFKVVSIIMNLAPIGAFGAMAFTISKFGIGSLISLSKLMLGVYLTCFFFVFVVLGAICKFNNISLWKFLKYIKEEILIVLGTSSSESALPKMMEKMEKMGCSKSIVGMVIPTGYSFNLDGTSIYLTMAAIFIAQATNTELTFYQELSLLAVLMLTSKGAAAVTGGGFITLAATLSSTAILPVAGITLLLGIDRFMSEARAITNLIGNGVATIVIAKWENEFDQEMADRALNTENIY
ncbi:dicarboxylate/amino acid:cation symporter [bacterium]|nr:MAG: dicarboxylate/amino acid:cation symporter [bacterium]